MQSGSLISVVGCLPLEALEKAVAQGWENWSLLPGRQALQQLADHMAAQRVSRPEVESREHCFAV